MHQKSMFLYESQFMQDMWGSLEIATAPSCYVRIGELLNNEILEYACILLRENFFPPWFSCLQGTVLVRPLICLIVPHSS